MFSDFQEGIHSVPYVAEAFGSHGSRDSRVGTLTLGAQHRHGGWTREAVLIARRG